MGEVIGFGACILAGVVGLLLAADWWFNPDQHEARDPDDPET